MGILDILFNAAGGGLVGSALHVVTSYWDTKREIMLLNAKVAAAEKESAWNAFAKSQEGANTSVVVPTTVWPWVASVYYLVDAFKQLTRPGLTWAGFIFLVYIFTVSDPAHRAELDNEAQFGTWTLIFWWVGARYQKNNK